MVVTVSMIISAINALTLSPALCGVLLKRGHGPKRFPVRQIMAGIDATRDGYAAIVRRLVRVAVIGIVALAVIFPVTGWFFKTTPTGFLPAEDQGAIFGEVVLPEGSSVNISSEVARQVSEMAQATPGVGGGRDVRTRKMGEP